MNHDASHDIHRETREDSQMAKKEEEVTKDDTEKAQERKPASGKQPYTTPVLIKYGHVSKFTRTTTIGAMGDGGGAPRTKKTSCIATIPELEEYRILLLDEACQSKYREAIRQNVRPGDIVLDLGTGSGVHALFACQAGATKVYAIESEPIIELAKETAEKNGYADRIDFIYGLSNHVELPEKVDVIVSHLNFLAILSSLPDAVARFLKKGGRMMPSQIQLSFVPIEAEAIYRNKIEAWSGTHYGFDFSHFRSYIANRPLNSHFAPQNFLAKPASVTPFDFTKEFPGNFKWTVEYTATRDGTMTGIAGWYSFKLSDSIWMTTEPPLAMSPEVWGHPLLPLIEPLEVRAGDHIRIDVEFYPNMHDEDPVWNWTTTWKGKRYEQTSFNSIPLSKRLLSKLLVN
jgi:protein arginine N-methyltransferase 1